jgi:hypothetical protein
MGDYYCYYYYYYYCYYYYYYYYYQCHHHYYYSYPTTTTSTTFTWNQEIGEEHFSDALVPFQTTHILSYLLLNSLE